MPSAIRRAKSVSDAVTAIRTLSAVLVLWMGAGLVIAAPEEDFHSRVAALYDFEPSTLNEAAMQAKSKTLDGFWSSVKAQPQRNLPLLRRELSDPSHSAFFFYDGAKLLLSLSPSRDDRALALRSIAKADLHSIQATDYLETVHWFAQQGFDTREAAFRILAVPDFQAFIPQHALTLGQDYSLIYMLYPMNESIYLTDLVGRLATERGLKSQKSLLLALWYTVTPAADAALKSFGGNQQNPAETRSYAAELIARKTPAPRSATGSSASSLKEARRKIMLRPISDESLSEFDRLTAKLREIE